MGLKQKANKDKVGDRPIPAPTTAQLEILTQLRLQGRNRVYARRRLLHEASLIMQSVNAIMVSYADNDEAPSMDTLWRLEERMIQIHGLWAEQAFYRGLELEIWRQVGE